MGKEMLAQKWYGTVEPKHRMYLNWDTFLQVQEVMEVEPKHRMYLNKSQAYSTAIGNS